MATQRNPDSHRLSVPRVALTGAMVLGIFYFLCWAGSFLPVGPATHRYLEIFANPPIEGSAVVIGIVWSVVFGGFMGAFAALIYNMLKVLR